MRLVRKYISILVLTVLLLTPSVIQLVHSFVDAHEDTEVCISKDEQHFHKHEVECDTCTFHFNSFTVNATPVISTVTFTEITSPQGFYYSLKNNSVTSFRLRGPPSLV